MVSTIFRESQDKDTDFILDFFDIVFGSPFLSSKDYCEKDIGIMWLGGSFLGSIEPFLS